MENAFLSFVASVMGCPVSDISMETAYGEFVKWDSLMMLTLVMELEAEYETNIPIESIGDIKNLSDLYELVK